MSIRIKELGGQKNTDKRHISLNDRSELIGQKWESLYQHEWTAAYEELCSKDKEGKCHKGPERHLMEVIEVHSDSSMHIILSYFISQV